MEAPPRIDSDTDVVCDSDTTVYLTEPSTETDSDELPEVDSVHDDQTIRDSFEDLFEGRCLSRLEFIVCLHARVYRYSPLP